MLSFIEGATFQKPSHSRKTAVNGFTHCLSTQKSIAMWLECVPSIQIDTSVAGPKCQGRIAGEAVRGCRWGRCLMGFGLTFQHICFVPVLHGICITLWHDFYGFGCCSDHDSNHHHPAVKDSKAPADGSFTRLTHAAEFYASQAASQAAEFFSLKRLGDENFWLMVLIRHSLQSLWYWFTHLLVEGFFGSPCFSNLKFRRWADSPVESRGWFDFASCLWLWPHFWGHHLCGVDSMGTLQKKDMFWVVEKKARVLLGFLKRNRASSEIIWIDAPGRVKRARTGFKWWSMDWHVSLDWLRGKLTVQETSYFIIKYECFLQILL